MDWIKLVLVCCCLIVSAHGQGSGDENSLFSGNVGDLFPLARTFLGGGNLLNSALSGASSMFGGDKTLAGAAAEGLNMLSGVTNTVMSGANKLLEDDNMATAAGKGINMLRGVKDMAMTGAKTLLASSGDENGGSKDGSVIPDAALLAELMHDDTEDNPDANQGGNSGSNPDFVGLPMVAMMNNADDENKRDIGGALQGAASNIVGSLVKVGNGMNNALNDDPVNTGDDTSGGVETLKNVLDTVDTVVDEKLNVLGSAVQTLTKDDSPKHMISGPSINTDDTGLDESAVIPPGLKSTGPNLEAVKDGLGNAIARSTGKDIIEDTGDILGDVRDSANDRIDTILDVVDSKDDKKYLIREVMDRVGDRMEGALGDERGIESLDEDKGMLGWISEILDGDIFGRLDDLDDHEDDDDQVQDYWDDFRYNRRLGRPARDIGFIFGRRLSERNRSRRPGPNPIRKTNDRINWYPNKFYRDGDIRRPKSPDDIRPIPRGPSRPRFGRFGDLRMRGSPRGLGGRRGPHGPPFRPPIHPFNPRAPRFTGPRWYGVQRDLGRERRMPRGRGPPFMRPRRMIRGPPTRPRGPPFRGPGLLPTPFTPRVGRMPSVFRRRGPMLPRTGPMIPGAGPMMMGPGFRGGPGSFSPFVPAF